MVRYLMVYQVIKDIRIIRVRSGGLIGFLDPKE